jgi:hypothetical protein
MQSVSTSSSAGMATLAAMCVQYAPQQDMLTDCCGPCCMPPVPVVLLLQCG